MSSSIEILVKGEPLFWDMFQRLRRELPIKLDYIQYSDFLKCFLLQEITSKEQLYFLCASLWLPDRRYKQTFQALFEEAFAGMENATRQQVLAAREASRPAPAREEDSHTSLPQAPAEPPPPQATAPTDEDNGMETPTAENPATPPAETAANGGTDWPEIRLKIKDSEEGGTPKPDRPAGASYKRIPFLFSIEKILPFGVRKTAQLWTRMPAPTEVTTTNHLDVPAMIRQRVEDGAYHQLIYDQVQTGQLQVVWLSDHLGSMHPFSTWETCLLQIVAHNKNTASLQRYYFHDIPSPRKQGIQQDFILYTNPAHTQSVSLSREAKKQRWNKQTLFIIFSDGGAAHKRKDMDRVRIFREFGEKLGLYSSRQLWLNPVRFTDQSPAQILSFFFHMIYPDTAAISRAVCGQLPLPPMQGRLSNYRFLDKYELLSTPEGSPRHPDKAKLDAFLQRYPSDAHWWLACHLAFPVALTADLAQQIWLNFRKDENGQQLDIPLWMVNEVLHSPIIREIGEGLYEMIPGIRKALLQYLVDQEQPDNTGLLEQDRIKPADAALWGLEPADDAALEEPTSNMQQDDTVLWGPDRKKRLAEFVQEYLRFRRALVPTDALAAAETLNYETILLDTAALMQKVTDLLALVSQTVNPQEKLAAQQKITVLLNIAEHRSSRAGLSAPDGVGKVNTNGDAATTAAPATLSSIIGALLQWSRRRKSAIRPLPAPLSLLSDIRDMYRQHQAGEAMPMARYLSLFNHLQQTHNAGEGFTVSLPEEAQQELLQRELITVPETDITAPRTYALLVGIDQYKRKPLFGCVNDVSNLEKCLRQATTQFYPLSLTDSAATKAAIVDAFRNHLSKAVSQDTVIVYLAGLGTEEIAAPEWQEPGGRLQCFIAYDGLSAKPADYIINNKEFWFLYHELYNYTGAHIVTIYDCARSLGNYPKLAESRSFSHVKIRSLANPGNAPFPQRAEDDYVFPATQPRSTWAWMQTPRIILSASEPDGTVIEAQNQHSNKVEGVFTRQLIRELKAANFNISYRELEARISSYTKAMYRQTASLYGEGSFDRNVFNLQISGGIREEMISTDDITYRIPRGRLHGVHYGASIVAITSRQDRFTCSITEINTDYTIVTLPQPLEEPASVAELFNLRPQPLRIYLANHDGNAQVLQQIVERLQEESKGAILFAKKENADFVLQCRNGQSYIANRDDPYRPLSEPILADTPFEVKGVVNTINRIAQWQLVKNLRSETDGPPAPLAINIFSLQDKERIPLPINDNRVAVEYQETEEGWAGRIAITVTNTTATPLYVAALFLPSNFSIIAEFLPGNVQWLEPGATLHLGYGDGDYLDLQYEDIVNDYNLQANQEYMQFIASPERFSLDDLLLEELPVPFRLKEQHTRTKAADLGVDDARVDLPLRRFSTQLIQLQFINPRFNTIDGNRLRSLLEYQETADFTLGLYYDVLTDEYLQPAGYRLKTEITLEGIVTRNSGYEDLKELPLHSRYTRHLRTRLYQQGKDAGKTRIMALGDSWFNYPLVLRDITNNLSGSFAITTEELGDLESDESFPLRDRINTEQPQFLLISAGMAELFTRRFPGYIRPGMDQGAGKQRSNLQETFFTDLQFAVDTYRQILAQLVRRYPDLVIILHGYDYFIPAPKGQPSWLGKCFREAGITDHVTMEWMTRRMVDLWNEALSLLPAGFSEGRVSYLDLRGTLDWDLWHDEFHPNNEGFTRIADRFGMLIGNIDERIRQQDHAQQKKELLEQAAALYQRRAATAREQNTYVADDPQKNLWQPTGQPQAEGYRLNAVVTPAKNTTAVFQVSITVTKAEYMSANYAAFILHDSFSPMIQVAPFNGDVAELKLISYEAFALGVMLPDGTTLELDLQLLPDEQVAPGFKYDMGVTSGPPLVIVTQTPPEAMDIPPENAPWIKNFFLDMNDKTGSEMEEPVA